MRAGQEFAPGIVELVAPDGSARQVADGLAFPNGMLIMPDDRTLIVAESYAKRLTAFDVADDGGLSNRRVWAELGDGEPDGICADAEDAVWYADVPNKRCVRVREGGEVLQTVELDRGCFACALGGDDGRTLFMVAQEWNGPVSMFQGPRTGQVLTMHASAPAGGRRKEAGGTMRTSTAKTAGLALSRSCARVPASDRRIRLASDLTAGSGPSPQSRFSASSCRSLTRRS